MAECGRRRRLTDPDAHLIAATFHNVTRPARTLHDAGRYKLAVEILNKLVQAEPDNKGAKDLLADAFEQLGYQQENPGLCSRAKL